MSQIEHMSRGHLPRLAIGSPNTRNAAILFVIPDRNDWNSLLLQKLKGGFRVIQTDQCHPIHPVLEKFSQHGILTLQIEAVAGNQ